ncbi:glycosyltransferase family 2 protein [Streptomyces chiangmaiensis]
MGVHIAVLMTCHNRKAKTLNALATLSRQRGLPPGVTVKVHLVDAGSEDGTVAAVTREFPDADVTSVGTDVFWGEGMRIASQRSGRFDYQMWLNDDVSLNETALTMLLATSARLGGTAVVVGAMCSRGLRTTTYSGLRRQRGIAWRSGHLRTSLLDPSGTPQAVDACHGNVVLIPRSVHRRIGDIDAAFPHNMGDWDFSLRARKAGIGVYLAPEYAGVCELNPALVGSTEPGIGVREALRRKLSKRELPFGPWRVFCLRHLLPWTPYSLFFPYIKVTARAMLNR